MAVTQTQVAASGQFRTKPIGPDDLFVWAWTQFFQRLEVFRQNAPQFFFQPSTVRANTDPTRVGIGSQFYETDTTHVFISDGTQWRQTRP